MKEGIIGVRKSRQGMKRRGNEALSKYMALLSGTKSGLTKALQGVGGERLEGRE